MSFRIYPVPYYHYVASFASSERRKILNSRWRQSLEHFLLYLYCRQKIIVHLSLANYYEQSSKNQPSSAFWDGARERSALNKIVVLVDGDAPASIVPYNPQALVPGSSSLVVWQPEMFIPRRSAKAWLRHTACVKIK